MDGPGHVLAGPTWQRRIDEKARANAEANEARKRERAEKIQEQIGGLPSLHDPRERAPISLSPRSGRSPPNAAAPRRFVAELDGSQTPSPRRSSDGSTTASSLNTHFVPENHVIIVEELKSKIEEQRGQIDELESAIDAERAEVRRLRTERRTAIDAQRDAVLNSGSDRIADLEKKVAGFDKLLGQAASREETLEAQLEESRKRERALRRELHEAQQANQELEVEAGHTNSRQNIMRRQLAEGASLQEEAMDALEERRCRQEDVARSLRSTNRSRNELQSDDATVGSSRPMNTGYRMERRCLVVPKGQRHLVPLWWQ